jgi:hypothetical protein
MTVRVFNGQQGNEQLVWRVRNGARVLEPESGWVNPTSICDYYMTLMPRDRAALIELLGQAERVKVQQEDQDEMAYDQARADYLASQKPLT